MLERYEERMLAIRQVATGCGYAIGVHGSGTRDLDLIAAPWIDDAKTAEELVEAIRLATDGVIVDLPGIEKNPAYRSHARKAWSIQIGGGLYIDISVMPILPGPNKEDPFFEYIKSDVIRAVLNEWKSDQHPIMSDEVNQLIVEIEEVLPGYIGY